MGHAAPVHRRRDSMINCVVLWGRTQPADEYVRNPRASGVGGGGSCLFLVLKGRAGHNDECNVFADVSEKNAV